MRFPFGSTLSRTIIILFFGAFYSGCQAQSLLFQENPKYEVRAVWLTTLSGLDWPTKKAIDTYSIKSQQQQLTLMLDKLKASGINTILFQTRTRAMVLYPSKIEPYDECLSGTFGLSPGYDPLAFAVEECHKRGMEIQAWVVTIPVGRWNSSSCKSIRKKYPNMIMKVGDYGYINPSSSYAPAYIASICKEIAQNYDVDGIHLDYIRYPEDFKLNISSFQARNNITEIVREVYRQVKGVKKWVKISSSPIGKFKDLPHYSSRGWNAFSKGCQDAQGWLKEGIMDELYPMMYFREDQFFPFLYNWKDNAYGRTIVAGLGIYFLSPKEGNWPLNDIEREMSVARSANLGYAFFRAKFFLENQKGIYSFTNDIFNINLALTPPLTWLSTSKPNAPKNLEVKRLEKHDLLSWDKVDDSQGGVVYNVYASRFYPVDINDAKNLLYSRLQDTKVSIERKKSYLFYSVTACDRYGNESDPIEFSGLNFLCQAQFFENDGKKMLLPSKGKTLDAEYLMIESLQGNILTTLPFRGTYADISKIKDGFYKVYSLNNKKIAHRLGFLIIKRD